MKRLHKQQRVPMEIRSFHWLGSNFTLVKSVRATLSSFVPICTDCSCVASYCSCTSRNRRYNITYRVQKGTQLLGYLSGNQVGNKPNIRGIQISTKYYIEHKAKSTMIRPSFLIPRKIKAKTNWLLPHPRYNK